MSVLQGLTHSQKGRKENGSETKTIEPRLGWCESLAVASYCRNPKPTHRTKHICYFARSLPRNLFHT
eukprot:5087553-Amphidinium_carterae.1